VKINAPADYDVRHFRFLRTSTEFPVIEAYEPESKLRWAFAAAVAVLSILAMVLA
jgi:hypothetical protein